jgi:flagellar hook-associated protein 1
VQALATSDETGLLAATGMNSFFVGTSADSIAVRPDLLDDPRLLAVNTDSLGTDGANVQRMADVGDEALAGLGGLNCREYARQMITGIGQQVTNLQSQQKNQSTVLDMLESQRETVSGVDINEEAAKMLVFQRMYQAMSQFISTQNDIMTMLFQQVR